MTGGRPLDDPAGWDAIAPRYDATRSYAGGAEVEVPRRLAVALRTLRVTTLLEPGVGTGRMVRMDRRTCQIGRMAGAQSARVHVIGGKLLEALERMALLRGIAEVVVHAQMPAEPFFARRGYEKDGERFEEQGVSHVLMRKLLLK